MKVFALGEAGLAAPDGEAMERLGGHEGKPISAMLLGVAQQYPPIQENHKFYIDQVDVKYLLAPNMLLGR